MTEYRQEQPARSSFENEADLDLTAPATGAPKPPAGAWKSMDKTQRTTLMVLGFLGLGIFMIAVFQARDIIKLPFPVLNEDSGLVNNAEPVKPVLNSEQEIQDMKNKDTDQDGISDYDELSLYNTSPYLNDSDSDGISDKDELLVGSNPNCPAGTECADEVVEKTGAESAIENILLPNSDLSPALDSGSAVLPAGQAGSAVSQPTPDQLRYILSLSGELTEAEIAQISDQDLLTLYQQLLVENPELAAEGSAPAAAPIDQYTATQVREMLRQQGVDDELLAQVEDAELMQMYQDALNQASSGR